MHKDVLKESQFEVTHQENIIIIWIKVWFVSCSPSVEQHSYAPSPTRNSLPPSLHKMKMKLELLFRGIVADTKLQTHVELSQCYVMLIGCSCVNAVTEETLNCWDHSSFLPGFIFLFLPLFPLNLYVSLLSQSNLYSTSSSTLCRAVARVLLSILNLFSY